MHAVIRRHPAYLAHILHGSFPIARLIDRLGIIRGPVGIQTAADGIDAQRFKVFKQLRVEILRILHVLRVCAAQISIRGGAIAARQKNAVVIRAFAQIAQGFL